jgi:hypothetical protein
MTPLEWPYEGATAAPRVAFAAPGSNICLDLHGDPGARLAVFSDGNHHMALEECLREFAVTHPEVGDVFYATAPPRVLVEALRAGAWRVGNLVLRRRPDVFLSPPRVLERLAADGLVSGSTPIAGSKGSVLLVPAGNPKAIAGVADLARPEVRLFISNPATETVSFETYAETLGRLARRAGAALPDLAGASARVVHGALIHHREAPQAVADGRADCAIVFHHLALRYMGIFPGRFAIVALAAEGNPDNLASRVHAALVGDGGEWGAALVAFLAGSRAQSIYARHGLVPLAASAYPT